jgi:hypothetical protein
MGRKHGATEKEDKENRRKEVERLKREKHQLAG